MCTPSRLPAPPAHFTQQQSSCKAGANHQVRWAGAWCWEGSELEVLEWRDEDVDMRQWRAWWRLGVRERGWRGLGLEDGYEYVGNGKPGGARGGRGWWTWGGGGVLGGAWKSGSGGGLDLGWGSRTGGGGNGKPDGARGGRGWWKWGGAGARGGTWGSRSGGSRPLGGCGGALGSGSGASGWMRQGGGVGSVSAGGGCAVRGESETPRLRDRASSLESGKSGGVGGSLGASRGAAWYWGGGGRPLPSIDPPRRGAVAAPAGGTGRVTVPGGVGPGKMSLMNALDILMKSCRF